MPEPAEVVGVPWYLEPDYPGILEVMEDAADMPDSFDKWLGEAEAEERRLRSGGRVVARAIIDPFEFTIWCRNEGVKPDAAARNGFAAWVASHQAKGDY